MRHYGQKRRRRKNHISIFSHRFWYQNKPCFSRHHGSLWSAICFKIMTRYTCGFFSRILAIIPATQYTCVFCHVYLRSFLLCGVFIPMYIQIKVDRLQIILVAKKIYMYVSQLFISGMPKMRAISQLISAPSNPIPELQNILGGATHHVSTVTDNTYKWGK